MVVAPFPSMGHARARQQVVAIVLGGGRGTRLYPLTRERAKPAVPLGGRYRLVDIPLSNCINSGINRIFVLTQFNSRSLHRHINDTYKFDVFSGGFVEVLAAEQTVERGDWFQGTADAIRQNLWHLRNEKCEQYLILSGDHLYRMDYSVFMERHLDTAADITVATMPVTREEAKSFGIMKVAADGRILEFIEKPQTDEELDHYKSPPAVLEDFGFDPEGDRNYLASMGVYVFQREVLHKLLTQRPDWNDFGKNVIPESLNTHNIYSYVFNGFWEDIGTVQSYFDVSLRLTARKPPFELLDPRSPLYSRARYLPGSKIGNADIENSILCEGTRVGGARLADSIVGIRSIVGDDVKITQSIVMGADYYDEVDSASPMPLGIGKGTHIHHAIIDKNARIGKNVHIEGGPELANAVDERYAIVDGIVVVLKNAVIPDGTRLGMPARR